jgi:hypothetical protein
MNMIVNNNFQFIGNYFFFPQKQVAKDLGEFLVKLGKFLVNQEILSQG